MPTNEREPLSSSRRAFLIGTGATVAWTAPIITAVPAAAQASVSSPPFVAASANSAFGFVSGVTVARPVGTADGDIMIAIVNVGPSSNVTTPPGWAVISGPNTSIGTPSGAQVRSYLFAYTGPTASSASTSFNRSGIGLIRAAIATFTPTAGATAVSIDGIATLANPDEGSPPFPGVTFAAGAPHTIVYLGGSGTGGTGTWSAPNPGANGAVQSVSQGFDATITYTLDTTTPPPQVNGTITQFFPFFGDTTDSVTYTVALGNV